MMQTHGTRKSGQSRLMDETTVGSQDLCDPEQHDRPFIIEWDATDMSSFESLAATDVVFVKYEGCELKVLDECKNDSVAGEKGAYKPPEWTSGSLETIDIHNEGELYVKLPLAKATLGGRIAGGERFHMEYFVAGTRYASRDAMYEKDLAGRYGCDGATHFVYNYNLGAFALGSANELKIEAGVSVYGFGGGGGRSSGKSAEKKGGDLAVCQSDSATEVAGCKAPIRLTLRKIRPGESPEATAIAAPDTPESITAAAVINTKIEMSDEARARYDAAVAKMNAKDGKGCLAELDAHDRLDPKHKSSDPKSGLALTRSFCVMMSGKCDAGKGQARKAMEQWSGTGNTGPEHIDRSVEAYASMYCQGKLNDRDALLKALMELQAGAYQTKKDAKFCMERHQAVKKLAPRVKPKDDEDSQVIHGPKQLWSTTAMCLARAGDCKKAFEVFSADFPRTGFEKLDEPTKERILRDNFHSSVQKCKPKDPAAGPT
jgi:hypothetical protein